MNLRYFFALILFSFFSGALAQDSIVSPSYTGTGTLIGITPPLKDIPPITQAEYDEMVAKAHEKLLNPKLRTRTYPFAETAHPKGDDPVWQKTMGRYRAAMSEPIENFQGQTSPYFPPDENGVAGPNHYMQTVNTTYAIYSKTGDLLAGPTNMNQLFGSVPGAGCNDGDPIILYDEMAGRWMAAEFSLCGSPDRMLVAVSATNDPTGIWYQYSFVMGGMPDYEKFGIWHDGYYMGTNTGNNTDIYVFERAVMLAGGTSPKMVAFDNPWRPGSVDGFMMVPPVDNDGPAAPAGTPGIFIAHQDDAFGGSADQLWIYELAVNWATPSASTFTRVQQLNVEPFDSNFGNNWNNIKQPGTTRELDAIPQVIMNVPQYRNFGSHQTIVCCHIVDVDATDHAGVRWYELRKTDGDWTIRQQGTYAPDEHSRWMASIALNGSNEIGLGYSISSGTVYPGIRYTGQSSVEYVNASGIMDIEEGVIWEGTASQTNTNRWGDYSLISVDPTDDKTFWYTNQYVSGGRRTRIASFSFGPPLPAPAFIASNELPCLNETVTFTDQTLGDPISWEWTFTPNTVSFVDGTSNTSQNPSIQFNALGVYSVTLSATNDVGPNSLTRTDYISVNSANAGFSALPLSIVVNNPIVFTDESTCDVTSWLWNFGEGASPETASGAGLHTVIYTTTGTKTISLIINDDITMTRADYVTVMPNEFNMGNITINTCNGTFYDSGGPGGNYANNQNFTTVINSTYPGSQLMVVFSDFNIEPSTNCLNDFLAIYNGPSVSSPLIGKWCGVSNPPGTIVSDNPTGSLTFVFQSNNIATAPGWVASISCISPVNNPLAFTAEAVSDTEINLDWSQNPEGDNVMIAWSFGNIGQPVPGTSYQPGDVLPGGGNVIYTGLLNEFLHTGLMGSTSYHYKAFSYTLDYDYSMGMSASATTMTTPPTLAVSPLNINVDDAAGEVSFEVISNTTWTAETPETWCVVTPSGNGNGMINVAYEANLTVVERMAQITVTVNDLDPIVVTLTQAGALPFLFAVPLELNVPVMAGSVQAFVTSNTSWTAISSNPEWCTVTIAGFGDGSIDIDYSDNTWATNRIASITLTAQDTEPVFISVIQQPAEAFLTLDPQVIQVPATAGSTQISVTSNFEWSAGSDSPWCSVDQPSGSGNVTLHIDYEQNTETSSRTAIISVTGSNLTVSVTLTQEGAMATLLIDPLYVEVPYQAGFVDFIVSSNVNWTAQALSEWLQVTPSGIGNGILKATYEGNTVTAERSATISVSGEGVESQNVVLLQSGFGLGIDENESESFKIYPNPAKDEFIIEVNPTEFPDFKVQLLNLAGTEILSKQCSGKGKYSIDISSVTPGSYMIRIRSGDKLINRIILIMN
ncbi:MAG: PKD domain-containing protein [Lentimicrobium sp.]|nr:PKD domain-containing protein [Lentimicrobium sp.]